MSLKEEIEEMLYDFDVALTLERVKLEDTKRPLKDERWFELQYRDLLLSTTTQILTTISKHLPEPKASFQPNDAQNSYEVGWNDCRSEVNKLLTTNKKEEA